jgi:rhodanese-related sulfurtransferase
MHTRLGFALALGLALAACHTTPKGSPGSGSEAKAVNEVTVAEVADFVKAKSATLVDANNSDTRASLGVVPGAILLTSSHDYALTELPSAKDTKLVFYCGGTLCRASDSAAKRASAAGYADVSVMRAGIRGWKEAGQPTETPRS